MGRDEQLDALRAYYAFTPPHRETIDTLPASVTLESDAAQLPGSNFTAAQLLADDYFEIRRLLLLS